MRDIGGRVAVVTGAASGLGLAISQSLVGAGAHVIMTDIDPSELEASVIRLGAQATGYRLDVTDLDAWQRLKAFVGESHGPVDILVNNAGIGPDGLELADMPPASFRRLVSIKLDGTFNGVTTFAAGMRERKVGHIVNTASMAGLVASRRLGAYAAAKFAVVGMSEVLRAELAPSGVGVSVLCPGLVRTRLAATTATITGAASMLPTQADEGMAPEIVGDLVVEAIRDNRPYIITHPEHRDLVRARMERILAAFDGAADQR